MKCTATRFAVTDVRVFDGTSVTEHATVLVDGDTVTSIDPRPTPLVTI